MKAEVGVVLKTCMPKQNKIIVLDRKCGKIVGTVYDAQGLGRYACGSVIQYIVCEKRHMFLFEHIEVIATPPAIEYEDFFFLHHLLELCYYFLPIGHVMEELFFLLIFVLSFPHNIATRVHKKMIIWRVMTYHGLYPELDIDAYTIFKDLMQMPIIFMLEKRVSCMFEAVLDKWMVRSIYSHPSVKKFKTISYIGKFYNA